MITIDTDKIKRAYGAISYAEPKHYIVITFWFIFRWRKFNWYAQRITDGMGWRSAYYDTLIK
jgi:hypothetical protein